MTRDPSWTETNRRRDRGKRSPSLGVAAWTLSALSLFAACGGEDSRVEERGASGRGAASATGGAPSGGADAAAENAGSGGDDQGSEKALYAVTTTVFDDTSAATYVALLTSLDDQEVDLSSAAEFAGWSSVTAHEGALFVGHGEAPEVERREVRADGMLEADAAGRLSFARYGLKSASLFFNTFVDGTMAHLTLEQTSRILWDPRAMEILDDVATPDVLAERDGLTVTAANYLGRVARTDDVLQPFFWHDADWYEFHQQSQIAIYSRDGQLDTLVDAPCPGLQIASEDEDGNVYLSGMVDTIAHQLVEPGSTLQRCVVRIDAGEHTIAPGWPRQFEELTAGRPAGVFYYLADGVGVLTVYHVENADPSSETFLADWHTDNWGLWLVNLDDWSAEPIADWKLGPSNVFFSKLDERLFVHRVAADFSETVISEIDLDGNITQRLTIPGYSAYELQRVR